MLPIAVTVGGLAADIAFAGIPPGVAGVTPVNFCRKVLLWVCNRLL